MAVPGLAQQPSAAAPGFKPISPILSITSQLPAHLAAGGRLLLKETGSGKGSSSQEFYNREESRVPASRVDTRVVSGSRRELGTVGGLTEGSRWQRSVRCLLMAL